VSAAGTAPESALIVSLRYLGDALLATPIAHAIKRRWPECAVDMLVFERSASMLEGNPDLRAVITVPERPPLPELLAQWRRLWRRYDLALVHQTGTRPLAYGWAAGRRVVGFSPAERSKSWWHRRLLSVAIPFDASAPTVLENMRLLQAAGLDPQPTVVPPSARGTGAVPLAGVAAGKHGYAVIQPGPRTRYKRWTDEGWQQVIRHLQASGLTVIVGGGGNPEEIAYIDRLLGGVDPTGLYRVDGQASLAQLSDLIAEARIFIGVDTGTTHVAAATGTPVVAIFGPTDPVIWGPWPARDGRPYSQVASEQTRGNVVLIQNPTLACVPCQQEGCDRHRDSYAACLDTLPPATVIAAIDRALQASS
jgi:heptosyltransferase III